MIIYYAGVQNDVKGLFKAVENGCQHLMLSYYYDSYKTGNKQWTRFRRFGLHIFLDSGGYSAWKRGVNVDIDKYMEYIRKKNVGKYVVLDKVGDPEKTYQNLKYMESCGLFPLPVFHMGSDFAHLKKLVDEGYYTVCLGGTVGQSKTERMKFFDEVFEKYPNVNFHGLGMTDVDLIKKYSWFSVDSTTWMTGGKHSLLVTDNGRIKLPSEMNREEKIGLNVKFFSNLEESINALQQIGGT